ncbi:ATP-dependent helicase HepA [Bradyrhizobium sp. S3.3.6]
MHIRGMLVELPFRQGIGKLISAFEGRCIVSVFHSVSRSERVEISSNDLKRGYLSRQTRVYVGGSDGYRIGRVVKYLRRDDGLVEYEVRFPNGRMADLDETLLHVRPWHAPDDPAEILAVGGAESQFLHDRRQAAIGPLTAMRGAAQGMSALLSAGVEFVPHQIAAVRRILADPLQRYLLADEVGLGKTIEAGLVARQHLIDNPAVRVVIAVPEHLRVQWKKELTQKLRFDQFEDAFDLRAHEEIASITEIPDVLIIDEAHHVVGATEGPLADAASRLQQLSRESRVLLLLSATPALSDHRRFLALLNLLDPLSHPLNDVDGFAVKLQNRREFGRLLLSLDPTGPALVLRQRAAEAAKLFPDDPVVVELAPLLIEASRTEPERVASLCTALRTHVADTYRIHQRLIRSRRADAKGWEFMPRGPAVGQEPELSHVRQEIDDDDRINGLLAALEEWRFAAMDTVPASDRSRLVQLAERYRSWVEALGISLPEFAAVVRSSDPVFEGELDLMDGLLSIALGDGPAHNRIEVMVESTARLLKTLTTAAHSPKIVVFSSSTMIAEEFQRALAGRLHDVSVFLLAEGSDEPTRAAGPVDGFSALRKAAVLVLDRHGEEGLNLSVADAIVHLDLPFSAARIEQRIGRLDRFGRRQSIIRHRVLLPSDDDGCPWQEWFDVLTQGMLVFNQSISDVQFLLDDIETDFFIAMLRNGPGAAKAVVADVRKRIEGERLAQDEQSALDRIALAEESVEHFVEGLDAAEEDEDALGRGIEKWFVGVLQLNKRRIAGSEDDPFSLGADSETLVPPTPWLKTFKIDETGPLTWRRRLAAGNNDVTLLRPGTPLMDAMERYTKWDDRGTAFVTWRVEPEWRGDPWFGFRLCFVIEADVHFENFASPTLAERALARRAQNYLPPFAVTMHVDADGTPITDQGLVGILSRPYDASAREDARTDINLGGRSGILADFIDAASFEHSCRHVRDSARRFIASNADYQDRTEAARMAARADLDRRRSGFLRRSAAGDFSAREDLETAEAIVRSIENPMVRLDAMGCFIISNRRPAEPSHERS